MRYESAEKSQSLTPEFLLRLHHQVGNQAVLKLILPRQHVTIEDKPLRVEGVPLEEIEELEVGSPHRQFWRVPLWHGLLRLFRIVR
jgi:hypothetical protein